MCAAALTLGGATCVPAAEVNREPGPLASTTDPAVDKSAPRLQALTTVRVNGRHLLVNGTPFIVRGVGYNPVPIGGDAEAPPAGGDYFSFNYHTVHERDFGLLRDLGANVVRLWGWNPGIDHNAFLDTAYGDGTNPIYVMPAYWLDASRDIADPSVRAAITVEFRAMVSRHKGNPALLGWIIGNELNAPWMFGNRDELFSLIDEMAKAAHDEEGSAYHPVTTPLADIDLITTIAKRDAQVPNLDVWSVQVYRGSTFGDLFTEYARVSEKPLLITEYGIDAYDDRAGDEYEHVGTPYQATYAVALWQEIAANSSVCAGGSIMAYRDEWWKGKHSPADAKHPACPDPDPNYHSTCGVAAGGHPDGYANEEWWGIVRPLDLGTGFDALQPRAVYYALRSQWQPRLYIPTARKDGE
jgi:hypothetical protein